MFSHFWTVLCMLKKTKKSKGLVCLFCQCSHFS